VMMETRMMAKDVCQIAQLLSMVGTVLVAHLRPKTHALHLAETAKSQLVSKLVKRTQPILNSVAMLLVTKNLVSSVLVSLNQFAK
jgi:hypothetical protein